VLTPPDTWVGTETQVKNAVSDVELLLYLLSASYCDEDSMIKFRQNPDNPCQLEQSDNGGATWELAFDYELCMDKIGNKPSLAELNDSVEEGFEYVDTLEQSVITDGLGDTFPDAVFEEPTDPQAQIKNDAICWALNEWNRLLAVFIETSSVKQSSPPPSLEEASQAAQETFSAHVQLSMAVLYSGGNPFVVGAAVGHFVYAAASNWDLFWQSLGELKDQIFGTTEPTPPIEIGQAFVDKISCLMYQNMKDTTITEEAFSGALSGVSGDNFVETALIVLWGIQLQLHQNWLVFLDMHQKFTQLLGIKENPYDCDGCLEYCYPLHHEYLYIAELPPQTEFFTEYPIGSAYVAHEYQPNQNQGTYFGVNQNHRLVLEYTPEEPCSLSIGTVWMRGNSNSASAHIWTYTTAGGWVARATNGVPTPTGVGNIPYPLNWNNTGVLTWEKCRITVTTSAPRINIFRLYE
jgi:hypothetical protein